METMVQHKCCDMWCYVEHPLKTRTTVTALSSFHTTNTFITYPWCQRVRVNRCKFPCETYGITCEAYVITCRTYGITCEAYMITCRTYGITCETYMITCETYGITYEHFRELEFAVLV